MSTNLVNRNNSIEPMQPQHDLLHSESFQLSTPKPRPNLSAHWEIENNSLICSWILGDRLRNSSCHL